MSSLSGFLLGGHFETLVCGCKSKSFSVSSFIVKIHGHSLGMLKH